MENIAQIGVIYSYTNKYNYTTTIKVSRITDKSIFYYALLDSKAWSNIEFRISHNSFKYYKSI